MDRNESSIVGAVAVPLLQAIVTAVLLSVAVGALAVWLEAEQPGIIAMTAFSLVASMGWLFFRGEARARLDALAGVVELAAPPPAQPVVNELRVHVVSERGREGDFLSLPGVDREQLVTLARGLSAGRGLSVHEWSGIGRPFSRSQYENLRGQLLSRGFIRARSENAPQLGYYLSKKGEALMRALSDIPSPLVSERARFGRF